MVVDKFGRGLESHKRSYTFGFDEEDSHDIQNKRLARVGEPIDDSDAITKKYFDITLESFPTKNDLNRIENTLKNIQTFFDFKNKRLVRLNEPFAGFHAATKAYVDNKDKITKEQIRVECQKVKAEAIAESDGKREQIRTEFMNNISSILKDINYLKENVKEIHAKQRISNLYLDVLYKQLHINKASVDVNVSEATNN